MEPPDCKYQTICKFYQDKKNCHDEMYEKEFTQEICWRAKTLDGLIDLNTLELLLNYGNNRTKSNGLRPDSSERIS